MSSPSIDHERTTQCRPDHRPQPTNPSSNPQPCRPRKRNLHDRTDAHEKEEPPSGDELRPIPGPPQADVVKDGGYGKSAHEGARLPKENPTGTSSVQDEMVSHELVPAEIPILLNRGGHPRSVEGARPRRSRLTEDGPPDHGRNVIHGVDQRAHPQAAAYAAERSQSGARHEGEARVEDAAAFCARCGGADGLNDVLRSVRYRQF